MNSHNLKFLLACLLAVVGTAPAWAVTIPTGNLYQSDTSGHIYEYTPAGAQSTFASGTFDTLGLAFDTTGNLYAGDLHSTNIFKFAPDGTQSNFATGITNGATGLAFDANGNLFAGNGDPGGNIYKFDTASPPNQTTFASGLVNPLGLAFDSNGNLYVADQEAGKVYKYDSQGHQTTFASNLGDPYGEAFDANGNLFVSDLSGGIIYKISTSGSASPFATGLIEPLGLAIDSDGNIFVGDLGAGAIYKYTPGGSQTTFATGVNPTFLAFAAVPEPTSLLLAAFACCGVIAIGMRRRETATNG
jgi:sugar lactone lactonase YvrE